MAETFQEEGGRPEIVIRGIGGRAAVAVVMDFGNAPGMQEANAQRLTTCWNACLGLPQETLAGGWTAAGMSTYAKGLEEKLRVARGLLLAVKVMSDKDEITDHHEGMPCTSPEFDELIVGIRNFLWGDAT
jgi:hypothetical protein